MKKIFLFVALLGFITMFISCAVVNEKTLKESGAKLFNQQDLMEFFKVERVATGMTSRGPFKIYYFPDRTQKLEHGGGGDKGKYRIENGQHCSIWKELRNGAEECNRLYRTGENKVVFVNLDGTFRGEMIFK